MKKGILSILMCIFIYSFSQAADKENPVVRIAKYKHDKTCAISYTFDDGMREHYTLVFPQLEKNNFKGTFWICGEFIENNPGAWLTWSQVKEMSDKGHEMSNHSWSHKNLTEISLKEVEIEIQKNDRILFEQTGKQPFTFCYPYNAFNQEVLELASENRVATRTQQYGIGTASTPESLEKWVTDLLSSEDWGIAMIHGITEGYDAFTSPTILWDHMNKVKEQEKSIWVGTFYEVGAYIKERDSIDIQVIEKEKQITIVPTLSLDKTLFSEPLTMIVEKPVVSQVKIFQGTKEIAFETQKNKIMFDFDPHGEPIRIDFR